MARIKLTKYQEKEYQAVKDTLVLRNRREYLNLKKDIRKANRYYSKAYGESGGLLEKMHISSILKTHHDRAMLMIHINYTLKSVNFERKMEGRGKNRHERIVDTIVKQSYKDYYNKEITAQRGLIDDNFETLFSDFIGGDKLIARFKKMSNAHLAQFLNMFKMIKKEVYYYSLNTPSYKEDALDRLQVMDINVSTVNGYIDQFDKVMGYKY